jgi:5'-deoxynucleotidase YfbR-like HD superfamily hydrolase
MMLKNLPNKDELYSIWEEHTGEDSMEATNYSRILCQLNKIADVWQALEYELAGEDPRKLDEWWINAKAHIKHPLIKKLFDELEAQRKK